LDKVKYSGLDLHIKHIYMPNQLGFCGPDDKGLILEYLHSFKFDERLIDIIKRFEVAYPFLEFIAKATGKFPFELKVPEAYWIGNELLDKISKEDFYRFIIDKFRVDKKETKNYDNPIAYHTFYVLNIYSKPDKRVLELIDNCRISWGKVLEIKNDNLKIEYKPLSIKDGKFILADSKLKYVKFDPNIKDFKNLRVGDWVSIHWNFACDILSKTNLNNIIKYTERSLKITNKLIKEKF